MKNFPFELLGENVREKLKSCGFNTQLNDFCKICKPEMVEIGDHTRMCDFVFIWGGTGVKIGDYVDFQPHCTIWGGGGIEIGNCVSIGVGTTFLTGGYEYKTGLRMVDGRPKGETQASYGKIIVGNDVYIGAHCTVLNNVKIGDGVVLGANSLANKDLESYGVYVGSPAKLIRIRPKIKV